MLVSVDEDELYPYYHLETSGERFPTYNPIEMPEELVLAYDKAKAEFLHQLYEVKRYIK